MLEHMQHIVITSDQDINMTTNDVQSIYGKLAEGIGFILYWKSLKSIPLSNADIMLIKNNYLPSEL